MTQLVSIIMPSYNAALFIKDAIDSVLAQSYTNWELLITDDNSKDNSTQIIEEYAKKDSRIKLYALNKNVGAAEARNNSIKNAKGRFIAFLDSDDVWESNKLDKQLSFMIENGYAFTMTNYRIMSEKGVLSNFQMLLT